MPKTKKKKFDVNKAAYDRNEDWPGSHKIANHNSHREAIGFQREIRKI